MEMAELHHYLTLPGLSHTKLEKFKDQPFCMEVLEIHQVFKQKHRKMFLPAVHEQVTKWLCRHPSRQIDEQVETEETQRQHLTRMFGVTVSTATACSSDCLELHGSIES
jgi:hypothetical protein